MNTNLELDFSKGYQNEVSQIAHERVKPIKNADRKKVYDLIDGVRSTFTIAKILGKEIHKISGRFTELKADNLIELHDKQKLFGATYTIYIKTKKR